MDKSIKIGITAITSFLSSLLGVLYIPVLLMVSANIIDYVTGLIAAKYRGDGTISSYKSTRGIFKKVAMWLLVVIGSMVDSLIDYSAEIIGWDSPISYLIASIVAIWILCTELISILENIQDIGIALPPFLLPLIKNIKQKAEDTVDFKESDTDVNDNRQEIPSEDD